MGMEAATPAGTARAGATGLSAARETAEAVPAERVRRNGHLPGLSGTTKGLPPKVIFMTFWDSPL
ncbi:hypothetical protein QL992_08570 [Microbacterium sp. APC 3898]|uniref:Uncharacterized protein n=1 Tax=Planococcus notacanthi TaxID=3035188 RepID=A0ABT7ZKN4_9BACL|nr:MULTISPECIES: hypothetical protein [Terrabacteria group]MDN3427713.1 hypothetical protein [Planococcus sp. APC 4016]MDN3499265.1 hypothetical protein [Microbacterium sp. APC 3898]